MLEYKQIKNDELDQYDAEPFEQQQFGTAGVEGVRDIGSRLSMFVLSLLSDTPEVNMWLNTDISLLWLVDNLFYFWYFIISAILSCKLC